jgi:hypothetical protein
MSFPWQTNEGLITVIIEPKMAAINGSGMYASLGIIVLSILSLHKFP